MKKRFIRSSALLLLALLTMMFSSISALAASEKQVDLPNNEGLYFTISNVVAEKNIQLYESMDTPVYISNAPVTVTFGGGTWGRHYVDYSVDGQLKDGILDGEFEKLKLEGTTYYVHREEYEDYAGITIDSTEEWVTLDIIDTEFWGEISYPAGSHVTLTKPGYYLIYGSKLALAEDLIIIQITAEGEVISSTEPAPAPAPTPAVAAVKAIPNASDVVVNGKIVAFEAYNIEGNNFFKLRDLAAALDGSDKSFEVTWDADKQAINLLAGQTYTVAGGELVLSTNAVAKDVKPTAATLYLDGEVLELVAYNINNNNYFKLRDIAAAFDIGVTWDADAKKVGIDTSISYTE